MTRFANLKGLGLKGNPIPIPPEILAQVFNIPAIFDYYFQTLDPNETEPLYEAKFIIVGEGGAGKTTLAKKLLDSTYKLDSEEKSTEGIEVLRWNFEQADDKPFRINMWDFGGQEIYHATHQFFLTKRSLYALVVDTRQDNTDLYYWLNVIELYGGDSPVFIIKNEKQDRPCEVNERHLRGEFTQLEYTLAMNPATPRGLEEIEAQIQKRITRLDHVGNPLPKVWVRVRAALENYAQNCNTITLEKYCELCRISQLTDKQRMLNLSSYLHDLGVILHFQKDPVLKNTVILKPEWGTAAVYKVLDTKAVRDDLGRFSRDQLDTIWNESQYADLRDELLQLMMRFKLCYEIPGRPHHYIAPQLLSSEQPSYDWDQSNNLLLRYKYEFMPKGILTRFIVEMHKFINEQRVVWKTGVVLNNRSALAEIIEFHHKGEIRIRVSGARPKELLAVIIHEINKINDSFDGIKVHKNVPCNCQTCKGEPNPYFYVLEKLYERVANNAPTIQCDRPPYNTVLVNSLINENTQFNESIGFPVIIQETSQEELIDTLLPGVSAQRIEVQKKNWPRQVFMEKITQKQVFISYAWGQEGEEKEEIANKIEQAFEAQPDIELIRDKNNLGYKGPIKAFMEQIGQGKAVVVVISDKYLKSPNCMFELVEIAAQGDFSKRIFPVVLGDANIYDPEDCLEYLIHWENKTETLSERLKSLKDTAHTKSFHEKLELYKHIRATIAELTDTIQNMNTLTTRIHTESGFQALIEAVRKCLEQ